MIDGLEGPSSVSISPDGSRLFVAGQVGNVLAVFRHDATTGSMRLLQAEGDDDAIVSFVHEPGASALALAGLLALAVLRSHSAAVR